VGTLVRSVVLKNKHWKTLLTWFLEGEWCWSGSDYSNDWRNTVQLHRYVHSILEIIISKLYLQWCAANIEHAWRNEGGNIDDVVTLSKSCFISQVETSCFCLTSHNWTPSTYPTQGADRWTTKHINNDELRWTKMTLFRNHKTFSNNVSRKREPVIITSYFCTSSLV